MLDRHKRISRMLGYTLHLGEAEDWGGFSTVCRARLTICERAGLAVAALRSLPDDCQMETAAAALGAMADPRPPFLGGMDEARFWASYARGAELKAYALAAFEAMQAKDRAAFLAYVSGREAA